MMYSILKVTTLYSHNRDPENDSDSDWERELEEDELAFDLQEKRRIALQEELLEAQKRQNYGVYELADTEKQIMELTTSCPKVVVHFAHRDYKRCRIMDAHLQTLAQQHTETKFVKIFVENANFLVEKLKIRVLPCIMSFVNSVTVDKIIGFEGFSEEKDNFPTSALEWRLAQTEVLLKKPKNISIFGFSNDKNSFEDEYA